jgi:hypothetical protein
LCDHVNRLSLPNHTLAILLFSFTFILWSLLSLYIRDVGPLRITK